MTDTESRPPQSELVPPGGIECFDRDMTAIISADVPLAAVQQRLAPFNQWLPIDGDPRATVGQLVEHNSTGPLRLGYGAWRDLLLGVQFRNGRNQLITAGGRTVKNVAGYDLTKFMVGQRGIFGRILTLTTRTYRRPAAALAARFPADVRILSGMLPGPLRPQWAMLRPGVLTCGYLADERALDYYEKNLPSLAPTEIIRRTLEEDTAERAAAWTIPTFRAGVPPASIGEFIVRTGARHWSADAAFGAVRLYDPSPDPTRLHEAARAVGGSAWPESGPLNLYGPVQADLLKRLKSAFDPDNTLEPLPF